MKKSKTPDSSSRKGLSKKEFADKYGFVSLEQDEIVDTRRKLGLRP